MKKEAVDAGVQYTISTDENGFLGEGSTENIGIVTADRILKFPQFNRILKGTTVSRIAELAKTLVDKGKLKRVMFDHITQKEAYGSNEFLLFGTTFDILAAVKFDDRPIGSGSPGPICHLLGELLEQDIQSNAALHTKVFRESQ